MEKKEILDIIAKNVRRLMNEQDLSINELARRCHVSTSTVSKVIHAKMSLTVPLAVGFANGLGVDLSQLMAGLVSAKPVVEKKKAAVTFFIGILSINHQRITCIHDHKKSVIASSQLEGSLDLADTTGFVITQIEEAIQAAIASSSIKDFSLKQAQLNLVAQSYEFEDKRQKFINSADRLFASVNVLSDWQLTYLSAFPKKNGISLIVDKGISLSCMQDNVIKKLGGWKYPVYDLGGENWLGQQTIRHTIEAVEGFVAMSSLAHAVIAKFNGKLEKLTEACFKSEFNPAMYPLFSEMLLRAYHEKDKAAEKIIQDGFAHVEKLVRHAQTVFDVEGPIALNGSLSKIYKPYFKGVNFKKTLSIDAKANFLVGINHEMLGNISV